MSVDLKLSQHANKKKYYDFLGSCESFNQLTSTLNKERNKKVITKEKIS